MRNERRIIDVLTRHQLYLEGVKTYQHMQVSSVLANLSRELRRLFADANYASFDQMTKAQFTVFMRTLRSTQSRIFSVYMAGLLRDLHKFMNAERRVAKAMYATLAEENDTPNPRVVPIIVDEDVAEDNQKHYGIGAGLLGLAALAATREGATRLWGLIMNAPIPANGLLLQNFVQGFVNSAQLSVENIVRKGYANRTPVAEVLAEIIGTSSLRNRDGQLNRIFGQAGGVINTSMQHISSMIHAAVSSVYVSQYTWVSVMDSRTSRICRDRDGNIYYYGEGPLPPAHINCRSKIAPRDLGPLVEYASFAEFAKNQPISVLHDILVSQHASPSDFDNVSPNAISIDDFVRRIAFILQR